MKRTMQHTKLRKNIVSSESSRGKALPVSVSENGEPATTGFGSVVKPITNGPVSPVHQPGHPVAKGSFHQPVPSSKPGRT